MSLSGLVAVLAFVGTDRFRSGQDSSRIGKAIAVFAMFHLVCISWIFFRATPAELLPAFKSITGFWHQSD